MFLQGIPGFDPDKWLERRYITLGVCVSENVKIPKSVLGKLEEVHMCFIHGNFLATVALARSVLEAVLIGRYMLSPKSKLGEILENLWEKMSELKGKEELLIKAKWIKENANRILHHDEKMPAIVNEFYAKKALDNLRDVIEYIYRLNNSCCRL